jgi:hypothetical protein
VSRALDRSPIHDRRFAGDRGRRCSPWCAQMIWRRSRRAVYRIYGEDEFLGGVGDVDLPEPVMSGMRERRLRRLAGVAMLAGAVGMVGGTISATTTFSGRGAARKLRAGLQPAIGRSVAGTEWRTSLSSARPRKRSAPSRQRKAPELGIRRLVGGVPAPRVALTREQEPMSVTPSEPGARVAPGRREHVEFGFER